MTDKELSALSSAIYLSRLTLAGGTVDTDDKRLRASGLYQDWAAGPHAAGEIYNAAGQTWECFAAYDNAVHPDITPENPETWHTFNRPLHGTTPETARPWCQPRYGTTDIYHAGEYMIWTDDGVYRCLRDTNFSPEESPGDWTQWAPLPEPDEMGSVARAGGSGAAGGTGTAGSGESGVFDGDVSKSDT